MQAETKQARGIRLWRCAVCMLCAADGSPEGKRRNEKIFNFSCMSAREKRECLRAGLFETQLILEGVGMADLGLWFGDRRLPAANGRPDSGTAQPHTLPAIWALACIVCRH
ncbi:hypothetical protein V8C43DRAFT_248547 [Trichoderma afarasin]